MAIGRLIVNVYKEDEAFPVPNALVIVTGENIKKVLYTDINGKTGITNLYAPEKEHSLKPQYEIRPYSVYSVTAIKNGLQTVTIKGVQVFPDVTSIQNVYMTPVHKTKNLYQIIHLPEHDLWSNY